MALEWDVLNPSLLKPGCFLGSLSVTTPEKLGSLALTDPRVATDLPPATSAPVGAVPPPGPGAVPAAPGFAPAPGGWWIRSRSFEDPMRQQEGGSVHSWSKKKTPWFNACWARSDLQLGGSEECGHRREVGRFGFAETAR